MSKPLQKLLAATMALVLSVAMVVTISYAWMTLSSSPIAEGLQITIGGGNTILVAADETETVDGIVYHYPGFFSPTLKFHQAEEYSYLQNLGALTPVSTADGLHWYIPEYYDLTDPEIQNGEAVMGQMKPLNRFTLDEKLDYANRTREEWEQSGRGGYVYLDFWVVSPGTDYTLRISRGDENGGSYLLELMEPAEVDNDSDGVADSYVLTTTAGTSAAMARVGFLVNEDYAIDSSMLYYQNSSDYREEYTKLRGYYTDPGAGMWYSSSYRFTIYEPNGDLHPHGVNGTYTMTEPLGWNGVGNAPIPTDIRDRLTVQLTNSWKDQTASGILLDELFQTAIIGDTFDSPDEVKTEFYHNYLQGQLMPYVNKGSFIQNTAALYSYLNAGSAEVDLDESQLSMLSKAGATDDICIVKLEKNVPQRIRMFVWLEGQDPDCVTTAGEFDFALSIELAGSQQDIYGETELQQENSQETDEYSGDTTADPVGLSLPLRDPASAWAGLRQLWQVQLLSSSDRKYGAYYLGRYPDSI